MRKLLLLFIALLTGVSGAWAGTPTADAYPVVGKTYYLYAIQTDGSRSYLYNDEGILKVSNGSKEDADKYKWSVSISDGKYTVSNKAGKVLGWSSSSWALVLSDTGNAFDLGKTVSDAACVSIYSDYLTYTLWWVSPKASGTYPENYYISSHKTNTSWSANYVFEEALSSHTLTNGSYYTIYCDNDSKQYLYDNNGTLAVGSASTNLNYVWKCIVNGDYYNLQNVQTGLYLGWKNVQRNAYNLIIGTADPASRGYQAKSVGMATIYGPNANSTNDGRFLVMGYDNSFSQSTTTYEKGNTNYSADFRFDAVDLSDYQICLGTNLGGTLGTPNGWGSTWTSGTTLAVTMTSSANNINKTSANTNGLDIRSGTALEATYTFTVPAGYVIASIELSGYAIKASNDQTITTEDGNTTVFTTSGNRMVYKPYTPSVKLTLTGANEGLFVRSLIFKLESKTFVSDLASLSNSKAYIVSSQRGSWQCADDATEISASNSRSSFDSDAVKFAIIKKNEAYYLYSINAGKYLKSDQKFTSSPTDAEQVTIATTGNSTYPWIFKFDNSHYLNTTGTYVQINSWSTVDEGNRNAIIEVSDFDATDALAMFETANVTYNLNYGGNSTFKTVSDVSARRSGDAEEFLPSSWDRDFVTYSYDPEIIGSSTTEVNVTATWNGPFEISSDYASAEWYVLRMRQGDYNVKYDTNGEATYYPLEAAASLTENDVYAWAFIGDPFDGFEIINKEAGSSKTLYAGASPAAGGYPLMSSTNTTKWIVNGNPKNNEANAFGLQVPGQSLYINDYAANRRLSYWTDNASKDVGSTFTVRKFYPALVNLNITPYFTTMGNYFSLATNAANITEANTVYTPALTSCTKATYDDLVSYVTNAANIRFPEDGYYRIKNRLTTGSYGYMGVNGTQLVGNIDNANDVSTIVKLTKTEGKYRFQTQGKYTTQVRKNDYAGLTDDVPTEAFALSSQGAGYGAIRTWDDGPYSYYHVADSKSYSVVGWEHSAYASQWSIEDATSVEVTLNSDGATPTATYYATFCAPFSYTVSGATAYTLADMGTYLKATEVDGEVTAGTPVLLKSTTGNTATLTIGSGYAASPATGTALTGTYTAKTIDGATDYVLGINNGVVGFYHWNQNTLGANRAYVTAATAAASVKGFVINWGYETKITETTEKTEGSEGLFDLSGRRISKAQKGLYIQNGKKVMVK
jgi:hypothetical protein